MPLLLGIAFQQELCYITLKKANLSAAAWQVPRVRMQKRATTKDHMLSSEAKRHSGLSDRAKYLLTLWCTEYLLPR